MESSVANHRNLERLNTLVEESSQSSKQMAANEFQVIVTKPTPVASTPQTPRHLTPNSSFVNKPENRRHTGPSYTGSDDGDSRRPSIFNGIHPRQSFSIYKKQFVDFIQRTGSRLSLNKKEDLKDESPFLTEIRNRNRAVAEDHFSTAVSVLYAKLLIVLGIAFPITDVVSEHTVTNYYEGFFVYLYFTSALFMSYMCFVLLQHKSKLKILLEGYEQPSDIPELLKPKVTRFGSFYLRVGAIAFGIGSMVYSGLEFGQYFELNNDERCQNVLIALIPVSRVTLCLLQMQFIFFSSGQFHMERHKFVSRFGLMHMLATNLCEWLYVIIEEAKHEIVHITHGELHNAAAATGSATRALAAQADDEGSTVGMNGFQLNASHYHQHSHESSNPSMASPVPAIECLRSNIMGSLIQNAAPFLFPCTIEYSLICAVILFEMWKKLRDSNRGSNGSRKGSRKSLTGKSANLLSIDCSNAQRGMFGGILVIVLTIIVLIMYFVLQKERFYKRAATIEVTIYEIVIYSITACAVVCAMFQMRDLKFSQKKGDAGISMDCKLLALAQVGIEIYCVFSIIGTFFSIGISEYATVYSLLAEIFSLIQTSLQTLFIMNAWWRRCKGAKQNRSKPGREIITFLLIANMSIWFINTLIKTNASFRPTLMNFYGIWAWTIITHLSMPLAIFYRFHSTICLFEIWKNTYKVRYDRKA
ncbi:proton channel OtopLc-like isoform X2 [Wyeomyia smithii]|uniref:proton channel OtopLc-like isoform X2 n=1 Tax=Wyeomyia smithii TaxID=174621 RepID=UPI002467F909|nr:proton channel OtopLc-like isoform X2 [Wyeomyia smithii]